MAKWTNKQFTKAIKTFRDGPRDESQQDIYHRIAMAAALVIRQRRGISEEEEFDLTPDEIADFLDGLDAERITKLKFIAEGVIIDAVSPPSSQEKH